MDNVGGAIQARHRGSTQTTARTRPHEEKFLARVREHIPEEKAEVGPFLPLIAGHLSYERALLMDNLIVREGEDVALRERVQYAEREKVEAVLPEDRVKSKIIQGIMHPAHIPLQIKSKPSVAVGAVTPGQGVASSAMTRTCGKVAWIAAFAFRRNDIASRFSLPPWTLGIHPPAPRA